MRVAERIISTELDMESWRDLHDIAARVWELAPWKWMWEADVFGVETPNGGLVFLSVMGALGEHRSVAVYPGAAGLTSFWSLYETVEAEPERILEISQVQLSFESKSCLDQQDRRIVKRLGLTVKGKNAWPMFRSYRPGFAPWFIEKDEAETLIVALSQLLEVAPRQRTNTALIQREAPHEYLIRAFRRKGAQGEWIDEFREVLPDRGLSVHALLTSDHVRKWQALPAVDNAIEVDFFLMPMMPIREGNGRPCLPYMLLLVDSENGLVLGQALLTVDTSLSAMCASVVGKLVEQFARLGVRPVRLTVRPGRFEAILRPATEVLGIELRRRKQLPTLDAVKKDLFRFMGGGPL